MKRALLSLIPAFVLCVVAYGQEPTVRAEPVPGSKPFFVTNEQFENLEFPANMDRLGKISDKEMKFRLDRFTSIISAENKTVEFVIQILGKTPKDAGPNLEFVYRYLIESKKINPSRISFVIATESVNETELWLIPNKSVAVPSCRGCTIIPAEDEKKLSEFFTLKKS